MRFSKFVIRQPCCNKCHIVTKLTHFLFFFYFPSVGHLNNICVIICRCKQLFIFTCWLVGQEKNCPTTTPCLALVHLCKLECFIKESSFGTKFFFSFQFVNRFYNKPSSFSHLLHKQALTMKISQPNAHCKPN